MRIPTKLSPEIINGRLLYKRKKYKCWRLTNSATYCGTGGWITPKLSIENANEPKLCPRGDPSRRLISTRPSVAIHPCSTDGYYRRDPAKYQDTPETPCGRSSCAVLPIISAQIRRKLRALPQTVFWHLVSSKRIVSFHPLAHFFSILFFCLYFQFTKNQRMKTYPKNAVQFWAKVEWPRVDRCGGLGWAVRLCHADGRRIRIVLDTTTQTNDLSTERNSFCGERVIKRIANHKKHWPPSEKSAVLRVLSAIFLTWPARFHNWAMHVDTWLFTAFSRHGWWVCSATAWGNYQQYASFPRIHSMLSCFIFPFQWFHSGPIQSWWLFHKK